jgi:hypothetical protein
MPSRSFLIFVVSFAFIGVALSLNGQVSFFQPPTYAGGGSNLFFADFNGDGKPDILGSDGTLKPRGMRL